MTDPLQQAIERSRDFEPEEQWTMETTAQGHHIKPWMVKRFIKKMRWNANNIPVNRDCKICTTDKGLADYLIWLNQNEPKFREALAIADAALVNVLDVAKRGSEPYQLISGPALGEYVNKARAEMRKLFEEAPHD